MEGEHHHCYGCKAEIFWAVEHVCPVLEKLKAELANARLQLDAASKAWRADLKWAMERNAVFIVALRKISETHDDSAYESAGVARRALEDESLILKRQSADPEVAGGRGEAYHLLHKLWGAANGGAYSKEDWNRFQFLVEPLIAHGCWNQQTNDARKARCVEKCQHPADFVCDYEDGSAHCLECVAEKFWQIEDVMSGRHNVHTYWGALETIAHPERYLTKYDPVEIAKGALAEKRICLHLATSYEGEERGHVCRDCGKENVI